jgi:uncharacterized RDD family membrane protein YckC
MTDTQPFTRAGLLVRLAAMLYDALLLLAVLFCATALVVALNGGEALQGYNALFTSFLFCLAFAFYAWFWIHGGQTLGMRAWRLRVQQIKNADPISWGQALLRFMVSILSWLPLGLGFWWMLIDRDQLTWHDRYSESEIVRLDKR